MGKENAKQRKNRVHPPKKRLTNSYERTEPKRPMSTFKVIGLVLSILFVSGVVGCLLYKTIALHNQNNDDKKENKFSNAMDEEQKSRSVLKDKENKPKANLENSDIFKATIHNTLKPISMDYNGRKIKFKEIKHDVKKSSVHVFIADNFLSQRECDGLTAAHFNHVKETSKKSPIVCFAGIHTMNKYLKDIGVKYIGSTSDFTPGTFCVNETFSRSLSQKFSYSHSTAFYRGDSKFSNLFEEQVERTTGLSKIHGGKFQITSYQIGVGYKNHTDCTEDDEIRDRFATVLVYLQDVKEGGETKFPKLGISVKPRKGRLLVWNNMRPDGSCDPTSIHNAAKVVSGTKVIIQRWYYYKSFFALGKAPPEPSLPKREEFQPRVSCDQYEQGSCRWYDEWGFYKHRYPSWLDGYALFPTTKRYDETK